MANWKSISSRGRVSDRRNVTTKLSPFAGGLKKMKAVPMQSSDGSPLTDKDLAAMRRPVSLRSPRKVTPSFTKIKRK